MDTVELHIASGDMGLGSIPKSLARTIVPWREALADGPVTRNTADLIHLRKRFVERAYSSTPEEYSQRIEDTLHTITQHSWESVTLHFDADLFCVVNAMFLVAQVSRVPSLTWQLPTVAINLTALDRAFIASCWNAYAGSDPTLLEELLPQAPSRLRFIAAAMRSHLERFPNVRTKLGKPQEIVREILDRGLTENVDVINAFIALDANEYGWGDVQILRELRMLRAIESGAPVRIELGGVSQSTAQSYWQWDPRAGRVRMSDT